MLIKILFTCAVIIGVLIFFRHRQAIAKPTPAVADADRSISPRALAYGLVGVLLIASALMAIFLEIKP